MKEYFTSEITHKTARAALIVFVIITSLLLIFRMLTYKYLTIQFNDARPVRNHIPVYYKGYKVGQVIKIKPCTNYKSTFVTVAISETHLKLPINTTALLTKEKREKKEFDYINIIYPDNPSDVMIKSGDKILGFATVDLESFLSEKALSGELDVMKDNVNNLLSSLNTTAEALTGLFVVLQDMVNENRPNLKQTTSNLADTSNNLKLFSGKLNNSIDEKQIQKTISNIDSTSSSIVITTKNFETITKNIDSITGTLNTTMPDVTSSIGSASQIVKNVDEITSGVSGTLKQNFGGLRLLFGKPINPNRCIYKPAQCPSCMPGSNIICK